MHCITKSASAIVVSIALHFSGAAYAGEVDQRPAQLSYQICANVRPVTGGLEVMESTQVLPAMYLPAGLVIRSNTMSVVDYGRPVEFVNLIQSRCAPLVGQGGRKLPVIG